ncbi:hypothetical protein AGMMS49960_02270 [Betaproteobacteria bacterium]|nr:hypothetical protein AGMMS49543_15360 [Betaproteobacteria bacterium]GHT98689.1 hypothetical protein AGMMS49960_02270 [Betaproteobacteria bacterium]GHU18633.1 hypothetical protein AGMMS50243_09010 [Betaproteobacteria bacterium]
MRGWIPLPRFAFAKGRWVESKASAQINLCLMYMWGRGVSRDDKKAFSLFEQAAQRGIAGAQVNLGVMYDEGRGVEEDDKKAAEWYRKAAAQGVPAAQQGLERM